MSLDMVKQDIEFLASAYPGVLEFIRGANFRHECIRLASELTQKDVLEESERFKAFIKLGTRKECQEEWFVSLVRNLTGMKVPEVKRTVVNNA